MKKAARASGSTGSSGGAPQGLHLHFDPTSGIAGDMTVAALVDLGVPRAVVTGAVAAIGVKGLRVGFEERSRGGFRGLGFVVDWPGRKRRSGSPVHTHAHAHDGHVHTHAHDHGNDDHAHDHDHDHSHAHDHAHDHHHPHAHESEHDHRDYAEIRRLLARARLDDKTRAIAGDVFERIAQVEAAIHGTSVDRVAFHEVGAYDSIADIVGAAAALAWLAPVSVSATPPVVGTGTVFTAHGVLPVPAPATTALLKGCPIKSEGRGELTTPTGAAILASVTSRFGAPPPLALAATGTGAGTRELADRPNVLRVLVGKPLGDALPVPAGQVLVVDSNIDDMNPQLVAPLMDALFAAGALDAWATPILMKKGRPALTISALCEDAVLPAVRAAFFANSTTLGVRVTRADRSVLARSTTTVSTRYGRVSVKLAALDGGAVRASPEFEDCRRLAARTGASVKDVLDAAAAAALDSLPRGKRKTR